MPSSPTITPRAQPSPTDAQAVVDLSTVITIHDFARLYPSDSPNSFQPVYDTFPDGSLVAPPLLDDLRISSIFLIITGTLLSIFIRNLFVSAIYAWRGKVKRKTLLYILFLSQLLGPFSIIPIIIAQFDKSVSCALIMRITSATSGVSLSLLLTGVLGVKVYRCLDNNRFVLAGLVILSTAAIVVLVLDLIYLRSFRSLSGLCYRPSPGLSSVFVTVLLIESFCICACFLFCVWKSQVPLVVRGRISLQLSPDDDLSFQPTAPCNEVPHSARNRKPWSGNHANHLCPSLHTRCPPPFSSEPSIMSFHHSESQVTHAHDIAVNAESQSANEPSPFPSIARPSASRFCTVRMSTTTDTSNLPPRASTSPKRPTSLTHLTRYIPSISLFRKVMRDELCYTALMTIFTVVSVAMALVGVKSASAINSTIWIPLDWALISLLVMHSFGRVIQRHENESLLLQSSAWYHDLHTDRTTTELLRDVSQPARAPRTLSKASVRRSVASSDNPFDLPTCRLFSGSRRSSRGDLHSLATSTSGTSNTLQPAETESARTLASGPAVIRPVESIEDLSTSPSCPQVPPEEWSTHPLETPPKRLSFDKSAHVS